AAVYSSRTNPAPFAPRYTLVIPGSTNGGPQGYGYGAIQVKSSGMLTLSGSLADGTAVTASGTVLNGGQWPLYLPLYHNQGFLLGLLNFDTNQPSTGLAGTLSWVKAAMTSKTYSAGFINQSIAAIGSSYSAATMPLITLSNGVASFAGGNPGVSFSDSETNSTKAGQYDRLGNASSNRLTLSITAATGVFSGTATVPGTKQSFPFHGVLLQNTNAGFGYFLEGD